MQRGAGAGNAPQDGKSGADPSSGSLPVQVPGTQADGGAPPLGEGHDVDARLLQQERFADQFRQSLAATYPGEVTHGNNLAAVGATIEGTSALAVALMVLILWFAILFIASRNGWRSFANAFRTQRRPRGRRFRATSARFASGIAPYVDVVQVTFTAEGLYIDATLPFRVFHRPFLVPWSSVESIKRKDRHFRPRYRITIQDVNAGTLILRLPGAIAADLADTRASAKHAS